MIPSVLCTSPWQAHEHPVILLSPPRRRNAGIRDVGSLHPESQLVPGVELRLSGVHSHFASPNWLNF